MRDSEELLQLVHVAMIDAGVDYQAIYDRLEYTLDTLAEPQYRRRHETQKWFWKTVEEVTGDFDIGLTLAPHLPVFRGEAMEYIFLSSPTLRDGFEAARQYRRLVSDAFRMRAVQDAAGSRLVITGTTNDAPALRHAEICFAYGFIQTMRAVTGGLFEPTAIRLCVSQRQQTKAYENVFDCPVEFDGEETEIPVDPALLNMPSPHCNRYLLQLHRKAADEQLAAIRQQDLFDDIQLCVFQSVLDGNCEEGGACLEAIARELSMTPRRLRAELTAMDTRFRDVVKHARYAAARRLLAHTGESIEEIAFCTGFSRYSAFCRAFSEWAGVTPAQYRDANTGVAEKETTARQVLLKMVMSA